VDFHERCSSLDHGNVFPLFSLTFSLSFTSVCFEQETVDQSSCVDCDQQLGEHTYSGEPLFEQPTWVGLFDWCWTQRHPPVRWNFCSFYSCFELIDHLCTTNEMDEPQNVQHSDESTSIEPRPTLAPSQAPSNVQSTTHVLETLIPGFVSIQTEKLNDSILTLELGHPPGSSDVAQPQSSCSPSRSTQVNQFLCFHIDFERHGFSSCFALSRMEPLLYPPFILNEKYNRNLIDFQYEPHTPCVVHFRLSTSYPSFPPQDTAVMDESDVEHQDDTQIDPNQVTPSISFCVTRPSPDYPELNAPCFTVSFEQRDQIAVKISALLSWLERHMHMNVSTSAVVIQFILSQVIAHASPWVIPQFVMQSSSYEYPQPDEPEVPLPTTYHLGSSRSLAQDPDQLMSRTATDYIASIDDRNMLHLQTVPTVRRILSSPVPQVDPQVELRVEFENYEPPRTYVGLPPWPSSLLPPCMANCLPDPSSPLTCTLQELFLEVASNLHRAWLCTSCGLGTDLRADVCPQCSFNCKGVKLSLYHTTLQCIPTRCPVVMDFTDVKLSVYSPCGRGHLYLDQAGRFIQPVTGHYVQDNLTEVLPKRTTRWTLHENQYTNNWMSMIELITKHGLVLPIALNERVEMIEHWKRTGPHCETYRSQARVSCFDWDNTLRTTTSTDRETQIGPKSTHLVIPATVLTVNDMSFEQWLQHHNYYIHLDLSIVHQCQSKLFQEYNPEWYCPESPYLMSPCYIALSQLQARLQNFLNGSWLDPDKVPDPTSYYPRFHTRTLDQCQPVVRQDPHVYLQWNIWLMTIACRQYHIHGRVFNASEFVHPDLPVTDYPSTAFCPHHAVNAHFCCRYWLKNPGDLHAQMSDNHTDFKPDPRQTYAQPLPPDQVLSNHASAYLHYWKCCTLVGPGSRIVKDYINPRPEQDEKQELFEELDHLYEYIVNELNFSAWTRYMVYLAFAPDLLLDVAVKNADRLHENDAEVPSLRNHPGFGPFTVHIPTLCEVVCTWIHGTQWPTTLNSRYTVDPDPYASDLELCQITNDPEFPHPLPPSLRLDSRTVANTLLNHAMTGRVRFLVGCLYDHPGLIAHDLQSVTHPDVFHQYGYHTVFGNPDEQSRAALSTHLVGWNPDDVKTALEQDSKELIKESSIADSHNFHFSFRSEPKNVRECSDADRVSPQAPYPILSPHFESMSNSFFVIVVSHLDLPHRLWLDPRLNEPSHVGDPKGLIPHMHLRPGTSLNHRPINKMYECNVRTMPLPLVDILAIAVVMDASSECPETNRTLCTMFPARPSIPKQYARHSECLAASHVARTLPPLYKSVDSPLDKDMPRHFPPFARIPKHPIDPQVMHVTLHSLHERMYMDPRYGACDDLIIGSRAMYPTDTDSVHYHVVPSPFVHLHFQLLPQLYMEMYRELQSLEQQHQDLKHAVWMTYTLRNKFIPLVGTPNLWDQYIRTGLQYQVEALDNFDNLLDSPIRNHDTFQNVKSNLMDIVLMFQVPAPDDMHPLHRRDNAVPDYMFAPMLPSFANLSTLMTHHFVPQTSLRPWYNYPVPNVVAELLHMHVNYCVANPGHVPSVEPLQPPFQQTMYEDFLVSPPINEYDTVFPYNYDHGMTPVDHLLPPPLTRSSLLQTPPRVITDVCHAQLLHLGTRRLGFWNEVAEERTEIYPDLGLLRENYWIDYQRHVLSLLGPVDATLQSLTRELNKRMNDQFKTFAQRLANLQFMYHPNKRPAPEEKSTSHVPHLRHVHLSQTESTLDVRSDRAPSEVSLPASLMTQTSRAPGEAPARAPRYLRPPQGQRHPGRLHRGRSHY